MKAIVRIVVLALVACAAMAVHAQEQAADSTVVRQSPKEPAAKMRTARYADTAVFQGVTVKLDILNPVLELARSNWNTFDVEAAVNVRLKNRFFPTFEFGYAGQFLQEKKASTPVYNGQGEFVRLGLDINPLRKHPEQRSVLLIGVRAGSGWQKLESSVSAANLQGKWIADAWGEVIAGVQVDIVKGFNMGWAVRMKFLFTERAHGDATIPYYIPGYGYRDTMKWGFNYYLGYSF